MPGTAIFAPFFGMLLLTFAVWTVMYVRRLTYITQNKVDPQQLTIPEKGARIIPEEINYPSYNLKNLFELPVVFYALCLYLFVTGSVDEVYLGAAWVFFAFRVVHSLIHCTSNIVKLRFASYAVAAVALWFMVLRAALTIITP